MICYTKYVALSVSCLTYLCYLIQSVAICIRLEGVEPLAQQPSRCITLWWGQYDVEGKFPTALPPPELTSNCRSARRDCQYLLTYDNIAAKPTSQSRNMSYFWTIRHVAQVELGMLGRGFEPREAHLFAFFPCTFCRVLLFELCVFSTE